MERHVTLLSAKNFEVAARFLENLWAVAVTLSLAAVGPILVSHHSFRYMSQKFFIALLSAYL
jgi:hypothetical protein